MNNNLKKGSLVRWLRDNAAVFTGFGTIALAIIGGIGLVLVINELQELRRQNFFIESNLRQTYRPLGVAVTDPENPEGLIFERRFSTGTVDRFSIRINYYLYNYGQGTLSYIGYFSFLTTEETAFRSRFLDGDFDTLNVDKRYSYVRRSIILPYDKNNLSRTLTSVMFENIRFEKRYFIYTLFLYEDQGGNLYDTEHLNVLAFKKPEIADDMLQVEVDVTRGHQTRYTFHYYSFEERKKLISAIRVLDEPKNHPMADVIEGLK